MGAGTKMMAAGLTMGRVQSVTRETIAYAREKISGGAVAELSVEDKGLKSVCLNRLTTRINIRKGGGSAECPIPSQISTGIVGDVT